MSQDVSVDVVKGDYVAGVPVTSKASSNYSVALDMYGKQTLALDIEWLGGVRS